ncbi:hypothetical protein MHYP_G00225220 [Metynnis hypsauchen]
MKGRSAREKVAKTRGGGERTEKHSRGVSARRNGTAVDAPRAAVAAGAPGRTGALLSRLRALAAPAGPPRAPRTRFLTTKLATKRLPPQHQTLFVHLERFERLLKPFFVANWEKKGIAVFAPLFFSSIGEKSEDEPRCKHRTVSVFVWVLPWHEGTAKKRISICMMDFFRHARA